MNETLIRVEGVSKKFCRSLKRSLWYGMKDLGNEMLGRRHGGSGELRYDEFWAVKDVSFELKRGECLGLIGPNGAGKTTLLRMLNGLIKPDSGRIEMHGSVGALIALGAGFNPVLTGRENIYVNASVLGLSRREIDEKIEEIIDFSELGEFMDAPVQSYSSGMAVRLGFAVATATQPDILILDEVLAVGDASFRQKCLLRLSRYLASASVIFVSHDPSLLRRISTTGLLMDRGKVVTSGHIDGVLGVYSRDFCGDRPGESRVFSGGLEFCHPIQFQHQRVPLHYGDELPLTLGYKALRQFLDCLVVLTFSKEGTNVLQAHTSLSFTNASGNISLLVQRVNLADGIYQLSLTVMESKGKLTVAAWMNFMDVEVGGKVGYGIPNQAIVSAVLS